MKLWARKEGEDGYQDVAEPVLEVDSGDWVLVEMEDGSRWRLAPMANGRLLVKSDGGEIRVETDETVILEGVRRP